MNLISLLCKKFSKRQSQDALTQKLNTHLKATLDKEKTIADLGFKSRFSCSEFIKSFLDKFSCSGEEKESFTPPSEEDILIHLESQAREIEGCTQVPFAQLAGSYRTFQLHQSAIDLLPKFHAYTSFNDIAAIKRLIQPFRAILANIPVLFLDLNIFDQLEKDKLIHSQSKAQDRALDLFFDIIQHHIEVFFGISLSKTSSLPQSLQNNPRKLYFLRHFCFTLFRLRPNAVFPELLTVITDVLAEHQKKEFSTLQPKQGYFLKKKELNAFEKRGLRLFFDLANAAHDPRFFTLPEKTFFLKFIQHTIGNTRLKEVVEEKKQKMESAVCYYGERKPLLAIIKLAYMTRNYNPKRIEKIFKNLEGALFSKKPKKKTKKCSYYQLGFIIRLQKLVLHLNPVFAIQKKCYFNNTPSLASTEILFNHIQRSKLIIEQINRAITEEFEKNASRYIRGILFQKDLAIAQIQHKPTRGKFWFKKHFNQFWHSAILLPETHMVRLSHVLQGLYVGPGHPEKMCSLGEQHSLVLTSCLFQLNLDPLIRFSNKKLSSQQNFEILLKLQTLAKEQFPLIIEQIHKTNFTFFSNCFSNKRPWSYNPTHINLFKKNNFEQFHQKFFTPHNNKTIIKQDVACSEFVAMVLIAALYELNLQLRQQLTQMQHEISASIEIPKNIVRIPISPYEVIERLQPSRFYNVLKKARCLSPISRIPLLEKILR